MSNDLAIGVNCVDDESGSISVGLLRNMSKDDLRFELRRLQQRCDVLERDKRILEEEAQIASNRPGQSDKAVLDSLTTEIERKNEALLRAEESRIALGQRHRVVLRHLWLEARALREVKSELQSGLRDVVATCQLVSRQVRAEGEAVSRDRALAWEVGQRLRERVGAALPRIKREAEVVKSELVKWKANAALQFSDFDIMLNDVMIRIGKEIIVHQQSSEMKRKVIEQKLDEKEISEAAAVAHIQDLEVCLSNLKSSASVSAAAQASELESLRQNLHALRAELNKASRDNDVMREEAARKNLEIDRLKNEMVSMHKMCETAHREYAVLSISERNLRAELEARQSNAGELVLQLKELTERLLRMESSHAIELRILTEDLQQSRARLSAAELEAGRYEAAMASQRDESASMRSQLESLKKLTTQKDEKLKELGERIAEDSRFQEKILELEASLRDTKSEFESLKLDFDAKEKLVTQQRLEYEALEAKLVSKEAETQYLRKENEELKSKNISSTNEIARLRKLVERECQERTEMLIHISELQDQLKNTSSKDCADPSLRPSVSKSVPSSVLSMSAGPEAALLDRKRPSGLVDALTFSRSVNSQQTKAEPEDVIAVGTTHSNQEAPAEVDAAWSQLRAAHKAPGKNRRPGRH
jgi:hypothetical protein